MTRMLFVITALAAAPVVVSAQTVSVTLSEWKIRTTRDTVPAGQVTFQINNTGAVSHSLHVVGDGIDKGTDVIPSRQIATLTVTLKPGTYELFCPMSEESHKKAGMTRQLVVKPADSPTVPKKPDN